jgi:epsilon-lactone hydrolase
MRTLIVVIVHLLAVGSGMAQEDRPPNTTVLEEDGTALITRQIEMPTTISPEAQAILATGKWWCPGAGTPEQLELIERAGSIYPVEIKDQVIGGVPVKIIHPKIPNSALQDRILVNLHGGGFREDSGSMLESIPIASLTGIPVVTIMYRMMPDHPFPAAVDDVEAVYTELLKTYEGQNMVMYGTSAGAILSAQSIVRFRDVGLPPPAAIGFFTGLADFSRNGDSVSYFGLGGFPGGGGWDRTKDPLIAGHDPKDPNVSPIYADLKNFPPTLSVTGTRDALMSDTVNFHRALVVADVDAQLLVYDALPHAFWYTVDVPESKEVLELMARFFLQKLER